MQMVACSRLGRHRAQAQQCLGRRGHGARAAAHSLDRSYRGRAQSGQTQAGTGQGTGVGGMACLKARGPRKLPFPTEKTFQKPHLSVWGGGWGSGWHVDPESMGQVGLGRETQGRPQKAAGAGAVLQLPVSLVFTRGFTENSKHIFLLLWQRSRIK